MRELDELESPTTDELLAEVIGVVPAAPDGTEVLVAVNGTIVGTSPLFDDARARRQFVVLLPDDALRPTRNEIRIALLDPGSGAVTELDLAGTD